ncbi:MAG: toll/interleukin-1 receptor domain-containing protein [Reyranella sp.]|nr:toll/interleukin-1 receptor domain-containing protein [Reyranella sp.]MBL6651598.1 toll/interleukin-1 receptor domain-containing protein [Reyranella sp.]
MSKGLESIRAICRSRQITLTTVAAADREYCDRLQTSLVRGSHELLYWGAGPKLYRGDIVALYTPKSDFLPKSEHSCVRRLYFVAADSTPGSIWNQHVFLHRRVNLDRPLTFKSLTTNVRLGFRSIVNAGTFRKPMSEDAAVRFLAAVGKRRTDGLALVGKLAREAKASPEICISYSGHDWTQAQRLKLWLDASGTTAFFVSPVGNVLPVEEKPLADFLSKTFSSASIVICLVPPQEALSKWIRLELDAALANARRVIFVRTDPRRPWPAMRGGRSVRHFTLRPTQEKELAALVKEELSAHRRS